MPYKFIFIFVEDEFVRVWLKPRFHLEWRTEFYYWYYKKLCSNRVSHCISTRDSKSSEMCAKLIQQENCVDFAFSKFYATNDNHDIWLFHMYPYVAVHTCTYMFNHDVSSLWDFCHFFNHQMLEGWILGQIYELFLSEWKLKSSPYRPLKTMHENSCTFIYFLFFKL